MEFDLAISISVSDEQGRPMIRLLQLDACRKWPRIRREGATYPLFELEGYGTATQYLHGA